MSPARKPAAKKSAVKSALRQAAATQRALRKSAPKARPARVLASGKLGDADTALSSPASHAPGAPLPDGGMVPMLPDGAMAAMRMSGGARFSSRAVAVFADGRVLQRRGEHGREREPVAESRATETQMADLRAALAAADLGSAPRDPGPQSPDTFAYEIDTPAGSAEVHDGRIPPSLQALVRALKALMTDHAILAA